MQDGQRVWKPIGATDVSNTAINAMGSLCSALFRARLFFRRIGLLLPEAKALLERMVMPHNAAELSRAHLFMSEAQRSVRIKVLAPADG